jgi:hypothetical protein
MIRSIPYEPHHPLQLELNEAYTGQVADALRAYQNTLGFILETIQHDETQEILAIFSGTVVMRGNLEISALVGRGARKYPLEFFRHTQRRIQWHETNLNIRRTQVTIRAGYPFLIKWIELLGFQREGLMRKFGPEGDDYYLYARVK